MNRKISSKFALFRFQIVCSQIERNMPLTKTDCDYYLNALKRFLTDERRYEQQYFERFFLYRSFRPSLLLNAFRCLSFLFTRTSHCQLTSEFVSLIQPFIHNSIYESYVLEILSEKNLSLSNLLTCSSMKAFECIFNSSQSLPEDEEKKLIKKFLPDLISSYRNNEHDLTIFFSGCSPEYTRIYASILMKICSFDILPEQIWKVKGKVRENEFDQIELEWSRLKLLVPLGKIHQIPLNSTSKTAICELNLNTFKSVIEIFDRNIRFLQQLKDKHSVREIPLNSSILSAIDLV